MLQCCDCLQWFHQECIRALSHQLMCGDRFFKFTCTLCNGTQVSYCPLEPTRPPTLLRNCS